jgi:hypothetical protein
MSAASPRETDARAVVCRRGRLIASRLLRREASRRVFGDT